MIERQPSFVLGGLLGLALGAGVGLVTYPGLLRIPACPTS
ncbi:hypothetical protein Mnod_7837 (plasmid) [Methylobacterium nodulans ORS 2060]|uniref:Uncharacterized protein n=1 Tax=Methylobacterium nodulans (strain LMG 21967 / CNCM I-2342 / ORS 2060) TaxID=460265 RepID=B8IXN4_METNO|nr:hypothetical protein Mnod_7837 [Methylobacterium nodulans ORS 2060]